MKIKLILKYTCTFESIYNFFLMNKSLFFSTRSYQYLIDELHQKFTLHQGEIVRNIFPDGELYLQIKSEIEDKDVVLIGGTISDSDTLELYDIANGLIQQGAQSLKIIIPYFGYATMERAVKIGEVVKAKNRALLFSSLPHGSVSNSIYLIDLHSEGIPYYFEKEVRCHHLYCKKIIMDACKELCGNNFVLASTDAGRAKWVESLANDMDVTSAFVYKQRIDGSDTHITGVNANVKDMNVIIYDDMIRTGGSLMQAAKAYQDAGAKQIFAISTHGLFTNQAIQKIENQGIIQKIICTNTHPNCYDTKNNILEVKSIAQLIFDTLKS